MKLQRAKAELKALEAEKTGRQSGGLAVVRARRGLPEHLALFVDRKTRLLQVLHDPLREHLARIVLRVSCQEPA
jgi:hypothetical protein